MNNVVFWDIKPQFVPHRYRVRFEDFAVVTTNNPVLGNVRQRGSCKNRISQKHNASIIRVAIIGELGTTLAVTRKCCPVQYR
jgi:hypothetical protein